MCRDTVTDVIMWFLHPQENMLQMLPTNISYAIIVKLVSFRLELQLWLNDHKRQNMLRLAKEDFSI